MRVSWRRVVGGAAHGAVGAQRGQRLRGIERRAGARGRCRQRLAAADHGTDGELGRREIDHARPRRTRQDAEPGRRQGVEIEAFGHAGAEPDRGDDLAHRPGARQRGDRVTRPEPIAAVERRGDRGRRAAQRDRPLRHTVDRDRRLAVAPRQQLRQARAAEIRVPDVLAPTRLLADRMVDPPERGARGASRVAGNARPPA
jgi:hypothetical protein